MNGGLEQAPGGEEQKYWAVWHGNVRLAKTTKINMNLIDMNNYLQ